ncbi:uncharacterized protein L3040_008304 [Drepanopeziza brunnea f. sp. 'multigermtubi']|uniref:Uncharacterized protein n=1 Tax=Marssonina brunnea f. sp. multigermtubi (strain MB_m1) TaxID=1072389 RepID=K1WPP4_MARBU|nr:uncharacterized protein MBM_07572 [Drepanopeziza brunnea f. sp. 'multigermtubi' MB_m1]EKD14342.1 hypothetical protein MBM_07572 [Drepanopeziza brunnea f. sp. 'multigermtubi' MB_m1]KAJ5035042.1 hypothetical protein L3040_008304 [Drepanopeziza brunnea f. sp. 'multigermtubi']
MLRHGNFLINNPRLAGEDGNLYKLALFFPAKIASPKLIWVATKAFFDDDGEIDAFANIDEKYVPDVRSHGHFLNRQSYFHIHRSETYPFKKPDPNETKYNKLLSGYDVVLKLFPSGIAGEDWPIEYLSKAFYEDVTVADLRRVAEHFVAKARFSEADIPNDLVIHDPKKWVPGVKISCSGDIKILGKKLFREFLVHKSHPVSFSSHVSEISELIGFALRVCKCGFDRRSRRICIMTP